METGIARAHRNCFEPIGDGLAVKFIVRSKAELLLKPYPPIYVDITTGWWWDMVC